jgi:hypothetical protein
MELAVARSSVAWQRRGQQAGRAASHEAPPLACLLEHSVSRHAGSVAHAWSGHGGWMLRCRRSAQWRRSGEGGQRSGDGVWKVDDTVEAERSREFFSVWMDGRTSLALPCT